MLFVLFFRNQIREEDEQNKKNKNTPESDLIFGLKAETT